MKKRKAFALAAGMSLACVGQAPAGTKPCRDKSGKIIQCPRVRKESPRCKDERGKFVVCTPKDPVKPRT